jgi:hypothetical protein
MPDEPKVPRKRAAKPKDAPAEKPPSNVTSITKAKNRGGRPPGPIDGRRVTMAQRRLQVLELRQMNVPYAEIGRLLHISPATALSDFNTALTEIPKNALEDYRRDIGLSMQWLINRAAVLAQWGSTMDGGLPRDADVALRSMNTMNSVLGNYARLVGANMPVQVEVAGDDYNVTEFEKDVMGHLARIDQAREERAMAARAEAEPELTEAATDLLDVITIEATPDAEPGA